MQDATVQSIPQTSQAPAAVAPSSYVVAAPQAAVSGSGGVSGGYQLPPSGASGDPSYQSSPYSVRPPIPTGGAPAGNPLGIGVQQGGEPAERTSPIPVPGSTVAADDSGIPRPTTGRPASSQATQQSAAQTWPLQPGLLAQLIPKPPPVPHLEEVADLRGNEPGQPSGDGGVRESKHRQSAEPATP
jgi:hypothetical protein